MAENTATHRFALRASWSGDGAGTGRATLPEGAPIDFAGATVLDGAGGRANPETLLLSALSACYLNTWAIFLKKLAIPYADPALEASCEVGKDEAGGFKLLGARLTVKVPGAILEAQRAQVEKTVALAEKYCIVSKAVRAAMPLEVSIEES
ncbi:MAG TPA: OsmC family protein [Thermoanaerobaculia bacterium]|nr:OsmC family protein [Thermoanaerobaculia bacterium]